MSLIKNREQFNKFIDILPDLKNDEVYFISLSARNKYLDPEEFFTNSIKKTLDIITYI